MAEGSERFAGVPETATFGHPVAGEITVADLGTLGFPGHPSEYSREVESWAKSVAQNRFL